MSSMRTFVLAALLAALACALSAGSLNLPVDEQQDQQQLSSVFSTLRGELNDKRVIKQPIAFSGRSLRVMAADLNGITLADEYRLSTLTFEWAQTPTALLEALMDRAKLRSPEALGALAGLALTRGEHFTAGRLAFELGRAKAKQESEVRAWFADKRGEPVIAADGAYVTEAEAAELKQAKVAVVRFLKARGKKAVESQPALDSLLALSAAAREFAAWEMLQARDKNLGALEASCGYSGDLSALRALKVTLDARRKLALDLIFDEKKWPYPYGPGNEAVTAEVEKLGASVREIWDRKDARRGKALKDAADLAANLRRLDEAVVALRGVSDAIEAAWLDYLAAWANQPLTVRNLPADAAEMVLLTESAQALSFNTAQRAKFKGNKAAPDENAWTLLELTNNYRTMMGRRALKMNFKLYWAAYHHSKYCNDVLKTIAHNVPGAPRGASPSERGFHEGYSEDVGENIAWGSRTAQSAHDGWLGSSGHHRNILVAEYRVMGNALSGQVWTEVFGALDEGDENVKSNGGK